jgi:hypothetical protein
MTMRHHHLSDAEIRNLFDAAMSLGFASERSALLAGLHPGFVASLPVSHSPSSQLLTDLHELNRTGPLVDDTVPLAAWLENGVSLVGPRREGELFERLLARVGGGKKPQRHGGPPESTPSPGDPPDAAAWSRPGARCLLAYVPEDRRMAKALRKHLDPMEREGTIAVWEPDVVSAGAHVRSEISARVREAELVVVLVSADLLASQEIEQTILRPALDRLGDGLKLFPIMARACDYWNSVLRDIAPLPRGEDKETLTSVRNVDQALAKMVDDLRYALGRRGGLSTRPTQADDPYRGGTPSYRGGSPATVVVGKPIEDIFRVGGTPEVTYVEPSQHRDITRFLRVLGKGLLVQGPSGVGKTTAVRKVLTGTEHQWLNARSSKGRAAISRIAEGEAIAGHLVIDELHRLDESQTRGVADLVKSLLDEDPPTAKVTLLGVPDARQSLFIGGSNLTGRVDIVTLGRQPDAKVDELIRKGEKAANVRFSTRDDLVAAARGSFMVAQQLCLAACMEAGIEHVPPTPANVATSAHGAIVRVLLAIRAGVDALLIKLAASDPRGSAAPRGVCFALLWLLSKSQECSVALSDVAVQVPELEGAIQALGPGELANREASVALRDRLYFGTDVVSVEDPQLCFYLRHLHHIDGWNDLATRAGLYHISIVEGRLRVAIGSAATDAPVHFLDAKSYPLWDKRAHRFYAILAGAYPEADRRAGIANEAEIDRTTWNNQGAPDVAWREILEAGARQGRLRRLLERVVADRSVRVHHEEMIRLCRDEGEAPEVSDQQPPSA